MGWPQKRRRNSHTTPAWLAPRYVTLGMNYGQRGGGASQHQQQDMSSSDDGGASPPSTDAGELGALCWRLVIDAVHNQLFVTYVGAMTGGFTHSSREVRLAHAYF